MQGYKIVGIYRPEDFRSEYPKVDLELEQIDPNGDEKVYMDRFNQHFMELDNKTWKYNSPKSDICSLSIRSAFHDHGEIVPPHITVSLNDTKDLTNLPEAIEFANARLQQANESFTESKQKEKEERDRKEAKRQTAIDYIKEIDKDFRANLIEA